MNFRSIYRLHIRPLYVYRESTAKLIIHPSNLNIFIHFLESNACMMPGFVYANIHEEKEYKT